MLGKTAPATHRGAAQAERAAPPPHEEAQASLRLPLDCPAGPGAALCLSSRRSPSPLKQGRRGGAEQPGPPPAVDPPLGGAPASATRAQAQSRPPGCGPRAGPRPWGWARGGRAGACGAGASRLVLPRGRRAVASCVLPPCARCAHLPSPLPAFRPSLASAVCLSHSVSSLRVSEGRSPAAVRNSGGGARLERVSASQACCPAAAGTRLNVSPSVLVNRRFKM